MYLLFITNTNIYEIPTSSEFMPNAPALVAEQHWIFQYCSYAWFCQTPWAQLPRLARDDCADPYFGTPNLDNST